jgi:hypothetical protein
MISYDDLVVALASWRARQGLPVAANPGQRPTTPRAAAPAPRTAPRQVQVIEDDAAVIEETRYDSDEDYLVPLGESTNPGKRNDW